MHPVVEADAGNKRLGKVLGVTADEQFHISPQCYRAKGETPGYTYSRAAIRSQGGVSCRQM